MNVSLLKKLKLPEVEIKKDETILEEGLHGTRVFVLLGGGVKITSGNHLIAKEENAGSILGELSALLGTNYVATVTTTEDSKFYVIDNFIEFLKTCPDVAVNVSQTLAYRLVYMNEHFVEIRSKISSINEELSSYLPVFSRKMDD